MDLIIVESPTKAKTLHKFLGNKYKIEATMGHIRDLPKSKLGVDVEHDFQPEYIVGRDRKARVKELVNDAKKMDHIVLATDPDREGEAIAWHIKQILVEKGIEPKDNFKRIVFHEITKTAILKALDEPRIIDMPLVDAQQARRILDRLVGYKLSPLLWKKLSRRWLSAGRVQSVAVRLIVEREKEIQAFKSQPYFTIEGDFISGNSREHPGSHLVAGLASKDGQKYESKQSYKLFDGTYTTTVTSIDSPEKANEIIADITAPFTITGIDKKEVRRSPMPPLTTSTLQQEASRRLFFSAKKTMQVAQRLYEEGMITYHRTDSVNLAEKFVTEAREYILSGPGKDYLPEKTKTYQTKSKVAQEAHEAIRPTDVTVSPEGFPPSEAFNRDHQKLYELIWKRALASQMADAVFDSTSVSVASQNGYRFEATGSVIKFDGFFRVMGRDHDEKVIPEFTNGEVLNLARIEPQMHNSNPPPRYSEATLIKALEEKDIGRPSTYAPIITTIGERNYIEKMDKRLVPTELGFAVTDFLVRYFPEIMELPFTANLEGNLDKIASGEIKWVPVIAEFYKSFLEKLDQAYQQAEKVKMVEETLDEVCPDCGNHLVLRIGRFGKFIACSTFPTCKYTRTYVEKIDIKCPRCGGDMVVKKSKRGKSFYGCGNYPKCTFAAWKKEDIK